jgi:hypothetical protein
MIIAVVVLIMGAIGAYVVMHSLGGGYMGPGLRHLTSMADGGVKYEGQHGKRVFINGRGALTVDGNHIAVQPPDRQRLLQYAHDLKRIQAGARAVGEGSGQLAEKSLHMAFKELLHGHSNAVGKKLKRQAESVRHAHAKLCGNVRDVIKLQAHFLGSVDGFERIDLSTIQKLDCRDIAYSRDRRFFVMMSQYALNRGAIDSEHTDAQ